MEGLASLHLESYTVILYIRGSGVCVFAGLFTDRFIAVHGSNRCRVTDPTRDFQISKIQENSLTLPVPTREVSRAPPQPTRLYDGILEKNSDPSRGPGHVMTREPALVFLLLLPVNRDTCYGRGSCFLSGKRL